MITATIDWIGATFKAQDARDFCIRKGIVGDAVPSTKNKGMFGYSNRTLYSTGMIRMFSPEQPESGEHLVFSGETLDTIWKGSGLSPFALMQQIIEHNGRTSRVDFAIDVKIIEFLPHEIYELVNTAKAGKGRSAARSIVYSANGGETVYIGSRQSEKFIRVYNKAAQTGTDGNWTRVELETKGQTAHALGYQAGYLSQSEFFAMCTNMIVSVFNCDNPTWKELTAGGNLTLDVPKKEQRDTRAWLLKSVAPSMARIVLEHGSQFWDEFCTEVEKIMNEKGVEPSE